MIEYPFGQAKSIGPGKRLAAKIKASKQHRAEKRTRKSELISEHGKETGKQLHKVEYASKGKKRRAQKRTSRAEELGAKGIITNQQGRPAFGDGYFTRRQTVRTGDYNKGNEKFTTTRYNRKGKIKSVKTQEQVSPMLNTGINAGTYVAKIDKTKYDTPRFYTKKKPTKYKTKGPNKEANTAGKIGAGIAAAALGAFGVSSRSYKQGRDSGNKAGLSGFRWNQSTGNYEHAP
tara:strand:+ start:1374 stop:2069 length:696 start_codon:yes stop_codon:yes gene_type:complete